MVTSLPFSTMPVDERFEAVQFEMLMAVVLGAAAQTEVVTPQEALAHLSPLQAPALPPEVAPD